MPSPKKIVFSKRNSSPQKQTKIPRNYKYDTRYFQNGRFLIFSILVTMREKNKQIKIIRKRINVSLKMARRKKKF